MVGLLVYVLIACIVLGLLYYIINNMVPEPLRKMATVVLVVIGGIFLIWILLQFAGGSPSFGLHDSPRLR
jgi:undecaprenyl pyrophosphate phosphatase UppP